jgi:class 3 adenylate cyclase/YHS domain-containing protein
MNRTVRRESGSSRSGGAERETSDAREVDLALMMADLCGYTALTETHGARAASDTVLRFVRLARAALVPSVRIVDSIGDSVFCAGEDTLAVVQTALQLRESVEREPEFLRVSIGIHRGPIVEREERLFGSPINLTARVTAHAAAGQILCTDPVARMVQTSARVTCRLIGMRRFKNLTRQVPLFELLPVSERNTTILTDPVCRMHVTPDGAAATIIHEGATYHFCSAECARLFSDAPGLYVAPSL